MYFTSVAHGELLIMKIEEDWRVVRICYCFLASQYIVTVGLYSSCSGKKLATFHSPIPAILSPTLFRWQIVAFFSFLSLTSWYLRMVPVILSSSLWTDAIHPKLLLLFRPHRLPHPQCLRHLGRPLLHLPEQHCVSAKLKPRNLSMIQIGVWSDEETFFMGCPWMYSPFNQCNPKPLVQPFLWVLKSLLGCFNCRSY